MAQALTLSSIWEDVQDMWKDQAFQSGVQD